MFQVYGELKITHLGYMQMSTDLLFLRCKLPHSLIGLYRLLNQGEKSSN